MFVNAKIPITSARRALLAVQFALVALGIGGGALAFDWSAFGKPAGFERKERHLSVAMQQIDSFRQKGGEVSVSDGDLAALSALRRGPANGYSWLALAWQAALTDRDDLARRALSASWHWAPHSRNMALPRVLLASRYWPELSASERGATVAELRYARQADPARFYSLLSKNARLSAMWRIAVAQRLDTGHLRLGQLPWSG